MGGKPWATVRRAAHRSSGHLIKLNVENLAVFDDELGAWRRANTNLTVDRPESVESIVCASSFLDMSRNHFVVLTHPDRRAVMLEQFATHLHETALPWFASSSDPRHVASAVPDALLTAWGFAQDLMEFLVSSGHDAEARALWMRVCELNSNHQQALTAGQEMAPSGDRPRWHTAEAIGWSAAVLGLL